MNPRLSIRAATLFFLLMGVNHTVYARADLTLEELLARYESSLEIWNRIQLTASEEFQILDSAHPTSVSYTRNGEIRRNGDLYDASLSGWYGTNSSTAKKARRVWDNERWYNHVPGGTAEESFLKVTTDPARVTRYVNNMSIAAPLWGSFSGNESPILDLLRGSESALVEVEMDDVDGRDCYVVSANTDSGAQRIWIDPERGYHIVKAEVQKRGDDRYYDVLLSKPPPALPKGFLSTQWPENVPPPQDSPIVEYSFTMDNVEFEQIGDTWVPVRAEWERTWLYENDRDKIVSITFSASNVDLDPDFEALGAFQIDVLNGTSVNDEQHTGAGSLAWKDGEIVPALGPRNLLPEIYDEHANRRELIAKALEEANQEEKRVIIVWGSNGCGWCHMLDRKFRAETKIQELLENHYVLVHIDLTHRDEHTDLALDYALDLNVLRTPHITILDEEAKPIVQKQSSSLVTFKNGSTAYSEKRIARMLKEYRRESK